MPDGIARTGQPDLPRGRGADDAGVRPRGGASRLFQQGVEEVGENPDHRAPLLRHHRRRDIATFLQVQFEDNLGAKIDVTVQPFDRKLELEADGEFQLSWQGWIADYNDPMTFLDL